MIGIQHDNVFADCQCFVGFDPFMVVIGIGLMNFLGFTCFLGFGLSLSHV